MMPTATVNDEAREHRIDGYTIGFEPAEDDGGEPWTVRDDGDALATFEDRESAVEYAEERAASDRDDRLQADRDEVCELVGEVEDEALLAALLVILKARKA